MRSVGIGICFFLLVSGAFGQSGQGTITGTVADPAGAVIPGASIEAKNSETGALYRAATTSTGNYTLTSLPPGVYQVSTSVPGFKQYVRTGITVLAAQTLRIDIKLEVGSITETVTVNADAPLLRTETGELSHNVSTTRLDDLPIMGFGGIRSSYNVTQLNPGTLNQGGYLRVNGAPANTHVIRIEGQDATMGLFQSMMSYNEIGVDSIEEVAIQTSNYAAEFGQAGGGIFNMTMRSGTNAFHGSGYEYLTNEALNASTPFLNTKNRVRRNDFGFTLGGPVWIPKVYNGHDKTFFFVSVELYRQPQTISSTAYMVPTLAYRDGDFHQALTGRRLAADPLGRDIMEGAIYDPATERLVNGLRVRDPFLNNTIPKDRFDPVAAKIQALIPLPTNSALTNNYLVPYSSPTNMNRPALKVDHNFGTGSKISFYMTKPTQNMLTDNDGISSPVTSTRPFNVRSWTYRLSFDQALRPTMMLHLGAGLQTVYWSDFVQTPPFDQLKQLGLPGTSVNVFPLIMALNTARGGVKLGSPVGGGMVSMGPWVQSTKRMLKPTGTASLTWVKGNHTYKFGAEMRLENDPAINLNPGNGSYTFAVDQTGLPSTLGQNLQGGTVGFPYASFLLGLVSSGTIGVVSTPQMGASFWAMFAQDSWKVTRRFTLDYGLRWDYQGYFRESYGRVANFSPTTPNPSAGGLLGAVIFEGSGPGRCNCNYAQVYPYAFGPRLGAAYQMTPKTVLRAGVGIAYGSTPQENRMTDYLASITPFYSPSYGDPAMILRNGPPKPDPWPSLNAGQYPPAGTLGAPPVAFDRNGGRPPRQIQWSLSIQREISRNFAIEASYVGSRGVWWEANALIDANALTPQRLASFGLDVNNAADRTLLSSSMNSALAAQRGFNKPPYAGFPMTSTVAQSLRPFPQFAGTSASVPAITYFWAPLGKTWYDSLQVKATKRFSYGLSFTSSFTWQKELMMGVEQLGGTSVMLQPAVNDVFNRPMNKYISGLSRPFVWVTAMNYTFPRLGGNKVLSWAVRDWTFGTVLQYASGQPILAPVAQNQLSSVLFRNTFANRVPGQPLWTTDINCHCFDPSQTFVLNPNAWVDPPAGQYGTGAAYYSDYRQMRRPSESMSLGRTFRIKEGINLNIRADFQNIFNRTFITNPSSTNAKATQTRNATTGKTVSGFGYLNTAVGSSPRSGLIVLHFQF